VDGKVERCTVLWGQDQARLCDIGISDVQIDAGIWLVLQLAHVLKAASVQQRRSGLSHDA
jgi:hypothetical protein